MKFGAECVTNILNISLKSLLSATDHHDVLLLILTFEKHDKEIRLVLLAPCHPLKK